MSDGPIRVAYFDLGHSKEEYGLHPTKYGGGGVAARYLKEEKDIEFHILAPRAAFSNVGPGEQTSRLHILDDGACQALRHYAPADRVIQGLDQFDILLHPHTCESLNRGQLSIPIVQFCGFDGSAGHPGNDYVLLYDDSFVPQFGEKPKYVRIGKPVPSSFHDHPKAPYVFQCSRHDETMNSIETARQCRRFGIKGYFAGPIREGYPLMSEIDGRTTHYLGEIDEPTKLGYYRHATLFALPHQWPKMPFNQSVIEAKDKDARFGLHILDHFCPNTLNRALMDSMPPRTVSLKPFQVPRKSPGATAGSPPESMTSVSWSGLSRRHSPR